MSGHTPGTWGLDDFDVEGSSGDNQYGTIGVYVDRPEGYRLYCVASVFCDTSESQAEYEANARLIAAAPDLLEALKQLLPFAEAAEEYRDDRRAMPADDPAVFALARAAITKAFPTNTTEEA